MAKSDVPISLFSFQDIVTSLTGIMVIVILVIALQMMETQQQLESQPEDPEWQQLLEEHKRLQALLSALKNGQLPQDTPEDEEFQLLLEMDESEVEVLLAEARAQLQDRLEALEQAQALRDQAAQELSALQDQTRDARAEARERLAELKEQMRRLAAELESMEQEVAATREQIRVLELAQVDLEAKSELKVRKLRFAFTGARNYTPILVECQGRNRFRAGVYLSKEVKEFSLNELCSWLRGFSSSQYYPVLLFRRAAFQDEEQIVSQVEKAVARLGKDPIPDDVEVFQ